MVEETTTTTTTATTTATATATATTTSSIVPPSVDNTNGGSKINDAEEQTQDRKKKQALHNQRLQEERDKEIIEEYNLKPSDYRRQTLVPRRSIFDLRTSAMRTEGKKKQGRLYDTRQAKDCGGLRVDEMIYGLKMAHLSCTDDSDDRLNDRTSSNCLMALEHLVGGDDPATTCRLPLSQILEERFGLKLDCIIDESGIRKGRAVDTQGFIASNEDTIVLSYRFSTTIMDWMANLSLTSSEWEPEVDNELGHAGWCSCAQGWFTKWCRPQKAKPRVHTGYYNNFVYTIPMIKQHIIGPLLNPKNRNAKPKKIYVVGCSLGAAISQIAYCYILEQLYNNLRDPDFKTVDRLISVTAGCPRVGDKKFRDVMTKKMDALRHLGLDRAVICRMVYNNDIVPHAPPNILTFRHLDKLVYITKNGKHIMINPDISKQFSKFNEIKVIYRTIFEIKKANFEVKRDEAKANFEVKRDEAKANFDEKKEEVAGAAHERMQSVQVAMHMRPSVATSASNNNSQSEGGDNNDANANANANANTSGSSSAVVHSTTADAQKATALALAEEEIPLRTAFEIECENSLEGIRDHMPYWYMIYLEKLQKEQNSKYSFHDTKNDVSHDLAAIVEEDDGDRDDDAVADAETASITSREKEAPTESSQAIGVVE